MDPNGVNTGKVISGIVFPRNRAKAWYHAWHGTNIYVKCPCCGTIFAFETYGESKTMYTGLDVTCPFCTRNICMTDFSITKAHYMLIRFFRSLGRKQKSV